MEAKGRKFILCRDCANFTGRPAGEERRVSSLRLCAAGHSMADAMGECESWVPVAILGCDRKRHTPRFGR